MGNRAAALVLAILLLPACEGGGGGGGGGLPGGNGALRARNVVLIVADDLGYADLGAHGSPQALTPHIDSIASAGVRCTNGYVSGPYCSPTRAGLLTGRYQQRFGHEFNTAGPGTGLPVTEVTLADRMRAAGVATGAIGKWHLGTDAPFRPLRRGFDEYYGILGGASTYYNATVFRNATSFAETRYLTEAIGEEAVDFIERRKSAPFFLYLTFNAVHTPMDVPPQKYMDRFPHLPSGTRKTYLAMLAAMDDAVGAVLSKLRAEGLEDDTLVAFISDNGGPVESGTSINGAINTPLRSGKRTLWEGGIRVPYFVKWPARLPSGTVYEPPVIQLDLFTTALAAVGGSPPPGVLIDGVDLAPFLAGTATGAPHDRLYWRFGAPSAVRQG
ncbi:MAG TPA: sulfatase-like hydrolase/transferase, partial [Planctomycetota bacterium]|nr:sulfatase-like hydrolase/transferase [Planctomycetota bacterium]